ncbi:uncharacterized protein [Drosophila bipectinata]|uniref:uncharacterized protein n=1 Tax=Drosophila bipectinata TaxID=42026 RepID=UPI001C897F29|nr:uncharacterized protein LOC108125248 [Drosophila bipectinata]
MKSTIAGVALLLFVLSASSVSDAFVRNSPLSCYKCSGSSCDNPEVVTCGSSSDDQCYLEFYQGTGNIKNSGCRSDLDEEFVDDYFHFIQFCDGSKCNTADIIPSTTKCIACDSREDSNCATDPSKITLIGNCGVKPYTKCMVRVMSTYSGSTYVQRGCVSSLERENLENCLAGRGKCRTCSGDLCNLKINPDDL